MLRGFLLPLDTPPARISRDAGIITWHGEALSPSDEAIIRIQRHAAGSPDTAEGGATPARMIVDDRTHVLKATLTKPFAYFHAGKSGAARSWWRSSARTAPSDRDEAFAPRS